jgi:hypothetical protein
MEDTEGTTEETIAIETPEGETPEAPQADETTPEAAAADEDAIDDEVEVSIGDKPVQAEEPKQSAPAWVRELRRRERELQREVRELRAKVQTPQIENQPPAVGAKPKLEDHDYDAEKFEVALAGWFERKRQADEYAAKQKQSEEQQKQAWQARLDAYGKAKASLRVRDYDDAEASVTETLNVTQQGIIVSGSENPALVTYAIGKDPAKLKELAAIADPVRFAFAVAKLETQLKVNPRKPAAAPEVIVKSTTRLAGGSHDQVLERLREEADKTGDLTKVIAYKAKLKAQAQTK